MKKLSHKAVKQFARAMQLQVMEPGFEQFHLNPKLLFEITKLYSFSMGEW